MLPAQAAAIALIYAIIVGAGALLCFAIRRGRHEPRLSRGDPRGTALYLYRAQSGLVRSAQRERCRRPVHLLRKPRCGAQDRPYRPDLLPLPPDLVHVVHALEQPALGRAVRRPAGAASAASVFFGGRRDGWQRCRPPSSAVIARRSGAAAAMRWARCTSTLSRRCSCRPCTGWADRRSSSTPSSRCSAAPPSSSPLPAICWCRCRPGPSRPATRPTCGGAPCRPFLWAWFRRSASA